MQIVFIYILHIMGFVRNHWISFSVTECSCAFNFRSALYLILQFLLLHLNSMVNFSVTHCNINGPIYVIFLLNLSAFSCHFRIHLWMEFPAPFYANMTISNTTGHSLKVKETKYKGDVPVKIILHR